jgi:CRISPR-associated protein Csb1
MPYLRLEHPKHGLITSLSEPHRLASAYLFPKVEPLLRAELGPLKGEWKLRQMAPAVFRLDPCSVLHGVFLVRLDPVGRLTRLLSAFIEAEEVGVVESGGMKLDRSDPSGPATEGKGQVPFALTEFTAGRIRAFFQLDLLLMERCGLSSAACELLRDLALLKLRRFLAGGLRLRSACYFSLRELRVVEPAGMVVPEEAELGQRLASAIVALRATGELGPPLQLGG